MLMKKLLPFGEDKYEFFKFENIEKDLKSMLMLNIHSGKSLINNWEELSLSIATKGLQSNIKNFNFILIDKETKVIFEEQLGSKVEFLPVSYFEEQFFIVNVVNKIPFTYEEAKNNQEILEKEGIVSIKSRGVLISDSFEKILIENKISNISTTDVFDEEYFKMYSIVDSI